MYFYRLFDKNTNKAFRSRDVKFNEKFIVNEDEIEISYKSDPEEHKIEAKEEIEKKAEVQPFQTQDNN